MALEKLMYERSARVFYYILIHTMAFMILLWDIYCVKKISEQASGDNILMLCLGIIVTILMLWFYYRLFKYRIFTSKVLLDEKGVRYISKVAEYYMPWEKVDRVLIGAWGNSIACIFFLDDKNTKYFNDAKLISNSMIFLIYDKEVYEYVKMNWSGKIIDETGVLEKEEKKEARKKRRLEKAKGKTRV